MPRYNYECESCGNKFEEVYRIDDRHIPENNVCKQCGKKEIKIRITSPNLVSPLRIDGLRKPDTRFIEKMRSIKKNAGKNNSIPDY